MPKTYEPIVTSTLTSSQEYLEVASIPSTYTDLIIVATWVATNDNQNAMRIRFNGDTNTNYSVTHLGGSSSAPTTARQLNVPSIESNQSSGDTSVGQSNGYMYVMDYARTDKYKTLIGFFHSGSSAIGADITSATWRSSSAITSIRIQNPSTNGNNVAQYTRLTIYGVKKA